MTNTLTAVWSAAMVEPGTLIGHRADGTPIALAGGADIVVESDEGPDDDDLDEDDDEDEDEPPAPRKAAKSAAKPAPPKKQTDGPEWTPPTRDEWDRYQDALKRNNAENRKLRVFRKMIEDRGVDPSSAEGLAALDQLLDGHYALPAAAAPSSADPKPDEKPSALTQADVDKAVEDAVADARETAVAETEELWRPALVETLAEMLLMAAGCTKDSNLARALKLIDLDDVDVEVRPGQRAKVIGVQEQIDDLVDEYPEWFRSDGTGRVSGAADVDGGEKRTKGGVASAGWLEKVDAQMLGGR